MSNSPQDSSHLSDQNRSDLIEEFSGMVDNQFTIMSQMRNWVPVSMIKNTDTKIVRRAGKTTLQRLTDGVRPQATKTNFGRAAVTVDTTILARDNQGLLNTFQADFNVRSELAEDQGKEMAKFFDQAFLIQAIKGAGLAAPANLNGAFGAGKSTTLGTAGDETDPDLLYAAISGIIVKMQNEEIDTDQCVIFVSPTQEDVLLNHDKLIDRDFSMANGDFADGKVKTIKGVPIQKTVRIPKAAIVNHYLSNADNNAAYDVTAKEAKTQAVIMHPKSLLAGETIPLTKNIWYDNKELAWFVDCYMAFGVSNRRPDVCGRVLAK